MKAQELRIGNYVRHKQDVWSYRVDYWPYKVEGKIIDEPIFQWEENDWYQIGQCCMDLDFIEPIPLTEDWLLKFGFERNNDEFGDCLIKNPIKFQNYNLYYSHSNDDYFSPLVNNIKFVHQLQNLYFALTGTELTLKTK